MRPNAPIDVSKQHRKQKWGEVTLLRFVSHVHERLNANKAELTGLNKYQMNTWVRISRFVSMH